MQYYKQYLKAANIIIMVNMVLWFIWSEVSSIPLLNGRAFLNLSDIIDIAYILRPCLTAYSRYIIDPDSWSGKLVAHFFSANNLRQIVQVPGRVIEMLSFGKVQRDIQVLNRIPNN